MKIDFGAALPPLTPGQRRLLIAVSVAAALTRLLSLARTPWDWDEILFSLGLREFDVAKHNPHPPGFPLYVVSARVFRLFGLSDFHSLQAVNLVAAVLIFPVTVFLCRELRLRFGTALSAALLLAFMPNVWFFGGTAFSDVPSMVLVMAASGFLMRGARDGRSYLVGAALLGIAAGYRPQNLMVGAVPALLATVFQIRRRQAGRVAAAIAIGAVIIAGSYAGAAIATGGWSRYATAIRLHREYIDKIDSFRAPLRPTLSGVSDDFFVRPFRVAPINWTLALLSLVSIAVSVVRLRWPVLIALAAFLPFWIMAWLILDFHSTSRFSIAWMPLLAILAGDGIWLIGALARRAQTTLASVMTLALTIAMSLWTLPALEVVRRFPSPPLQAVDWILQYANRSARLYVHKSMAPYAAYYLGHYEVEVSDGAPAARLSRQLAYYLTERQTELGPAHQFRFARGNLWNIVRRRYFVVSVVPLSGQPDFVSGWYDEESSGGSTWRWMGKRSVTLLPRLRRPARLDLRFSIPRSRAGPPPRVTIQLNGDVLDAFTAGEPAVERSFAIDRPALRDRNELVIEIDRVVNPLAAGLSGDPRDLGLRLERLEWISIDG
ncbi:MAG TPA: hypothetical protein VMS98_19130 [Thermoanaerobaculia bacterium]|nr:hypothetical protein [Thermoanaerobaculia bacterium]